MTLRDFLKIGFRWLLAIGCVGGAFAVVFTALTKTQSAEFFTAGVPLLIAMFMLTIGALLISPELVELAATPIRSFFDHLFFPGTSFGKSPPDYTLPRYYRKEHRYAEALHWYQRLLRAHPQELDAALEAMETAFESGDPVLARKIRKTALRKLRDEAARQEVWKRYASLLTEREPPETVADGNAVK